MEKKKYAFAGHETIQAMAHSLFRFQTLEQAQEVTNRLAKDFTLAPKLSDPDDKKSFVLWVRDLEVTPEQDKLGFVGNFGRITIHQLPKGGKWTLTLTKIDVPLNKHPQRKPVPRRHPNMGHPVIRSASRNKTWPTMQEAGAQLVKLQEEFPDISVPGLNSIKILAYIKADKGDSPVQRLELKVVKKDEGVYTIAIRNMTQERMPKTQRVVEEIPQAAPVAGEAVAKAVPAEKPGFFADMVTKGKKKKKK